MPLWPFRRRRRVAVSALSPDALLVTEDLLRRNVEDIFIVRERGSRGHAFLFGGELLLEPLGDSGIVRLNLRPYRVRGGDRDALLDAFLASAAEVRPDRARFSHAWRALGDELRLGPVGRLTRDAWKALDADTAPRGYPAVHHSETYERTRRPAYRVLTAARAQALAAGLHERPLPSGVHDPHEPPAPDGIALISARSGGSCRPPGLSACEQIGYRLQTAGFLKSFLERFPVA